MKLVMLSSDNFLGAAPVETHHVGFKKYFFELYYTHMSLENTLGVFSASAPSFPCRLLAGLLHILSPDYIINILTNSISDMCVGMHLDYSYDPTSKRRHQLYLRLNLFSYNTLL